MIEKRNKKNVNRIVGRKKELRKKEESLKEERKD